MNGYELDDFENHETNAVCGLTIEWKDPKVDDETGTAWKGHGVTLLKLNGFFWIYEYGKMRGPYTDIYEVCDRIAEMAEAEWIIYALFDMNWKKLKSRSNPNM
jgi:hypothetical protein